MNPFEQAAKNLPGHWTKGSLTDGQGNYCGIGHVYKILGVTDEEMAANFRVSDELKRYAKFVNKIVAEQYPETSTFLADLNDRPDTTEEDIVAILEKAAAKWEETHNFTD